MASSGNYSVTASYRRLTFAWSVSSRDETAMTTTISWSLTLYYTGSGSGLSLDWNAGTVTIDGNSYATSSGGAYVTPTSPGTIASGTTTITHNADGMKTFAFSFNIPFRNYSPMSGNSTATLDPFLKQAVLVNAPNFTDEDNPTITYTNFSGQHIDSLQAAISFTGGNDDIAYRDVPKGDGGTAQLSYTFNLTDAERQTLWTKLNEGAYTTSVRFYLRTRAGGETSWDYVTRTLTFINYTPTISPTVYDVNEKTLALTGNKNKLIRYMSTAYFDTGAQARKGATLDTQYVRNGDVTVTDQQTGTIEGVTSNTFYYSATDSRGDTERDFTVFNIDNGYFIEYVKLTCNVSADQMTAEGNINITVTGKYYRGSLGTTQNSLSLRYSLNKENTEDIWTDLGTVTPTVDSDNNYTYTFTISGLDYLSVYKLSVCAKDKVMAEESVARYTLASTPIFDWSKNDFNFNVPVNMTQGYMYPQTILWTGESQLGASDTITLNEPINKQASGIVLIFSLYRDGAAEDVSVHSFFVSRVQTQYLFGGAACPNLFMMGINSNLSVFGSKYVYISNTTLRGFSGNTASGTSQCGITFDNSKFVLRYVLGV